MSDLDGIDLLLNQAIAAAKRGDKEEARQLLEQVLQIDPDSEKAWMWFSSVASGPEERAAALQNVLRVNPDNERAVAALAKMGLKPEAATAAAVKFLAGGKEIIPGVTNRTLGALGIGGIVITIVLVMVILGVTGRANSEIIARTEQVRQQVSVQTEVAAQQVTRVAALTQTSAALATPTPTGGIPLRTEVPTFTPTASPSPTADPNVRSFPAPSGLGGTLAGWSGRDVQESGFLPASLFDVTTGAITAIGGEYANDLDLHPNGQRVIYSRVDQMTFGTALTAINLNGTEREDVGTRWFTTSPNVQNARQARYNTDGSQIVFIADDASTGASGVYLLDLSPRPPDAQNLPPVLRPLTNDPAEYSFPAWSPDNNRIAVIRNNVDSTTPGADIQVIDIATMTMTPVTTDFTTFIETEVRWSPDGTLLVYAAAPANDPENYDIVVRNADGSGVPLLISRSPGADSHPIFSPDGRYIAFSSTRHFDQVDVFIYEPQTDTLFQLTSSREEDYVGGWR